MSRDLLIEYSHDYDNYADPLVSVIIPTFNRETTIASTIASIKTQNYQNIEVIVVDDGSFDNTICVVKKIARDFHIKLIEHGINKGVCAARNTGLRHSSGTYVSFLDSDDIWHPEFLRQLVQCLTIKGAHVGCALSSYIAIDEFGNQKVWTQNNEGDLSGLMLRYNCAGALSCSVFRASAVKNIGGFDTRYPGSEDWELYIRVSKKWLFTSTATILCYKYDLDKKGRKSEIRRKRLLGHMRMYREHLRYTMKTDRVAAGQFKKKVGKILILNGRYRMGSKLIFSSLKQEKTIEFKSIVFLVAAKMGCAPLVLDMARKILKVYRRLNRRGQM